MKKLINLKITTSQIRDDDSEDTIILNVDGFLEKTNSAYKIEYISFIDEITEIKNTIYIKNDAVFIYNKGAFGTNLILRENKTHECIYHTPYGNLNMKIFPTTVTYYIDLINGGNIILSYQLNINNKLVGVNHIKIDFKYINE